MIIEKVKFIEELEDWALFALGLHGFAFISCSYLCLSKDWPEE